MPRWRPTTGVQRRVRRYLSLVLRAMWTAARDRNGDADRRVYEFDATCLASADVEFFLSAIQHTTCCITSCKQQLEQAPDSTSGVYTMCGRDGADDYDVTATWRQMEAAGPWS